MSRAVLILLWWLSGTPVVYPLVLSILNLRIVHECGLGLLMVVPTSKLLQLLLTHVVECWLHSVCVERPSSAPMRNSTTIAESTSYVFHAVRPAVLLIEEVSVEGLVEEQVLLRHSMVWNLAQVSLNVHVSAWLWICDVLNSSDLVSDLHVGLFAWIARVEGLIILKSVQVLVILLEHFLVVLAITLRVEVVKQAEEDLERDERVGTGLML